MYSVSLHRSYPLCLWVNQGHCLSGHSRPPESGSHLHTDWFGFLAAGPVGSATCPLCTRTTLLTSSCNWERSNPKMTFQVFSCFPSFFQNQKVSDFQTNENVDGVMKRRLVAVIPSHLWPLKCQICLPVHTWCRGSLHLPGGCRALSPPAEGRLSPHPLGTGWPSCCECAVLWARWGHSSPWSRRPIRTTHSGHSL